MKLRAQVRQPFRVNNAQRNRNENLRMKVLDMVTSGVVDTTQERTDQGVYFTHVGWMRNILRLEFGDNWRYPSSKPIRKKRST